jgi:hypothetical protein
MTSPSLAAMTVPVTELSTFENRVAASAYARREQKDYRRNRDIKLLHTWRDRSRSSVGRSRGGSRPLPNGTNRIRIGPPDR